MRRPRKRKTRTIEERIWKFQDEKSARPVTINAGQKTLVMLQGLARQGTFHTSCGRLLQFVLEHATKGADGNWYYLGPVNLAADAANVEHKQALRCMKRFVENGVLEKIDREGGGKVKPYRILIR